MLRTVTLICVFCLVIQGHLHQAPTSLLSFVFWDQRFSEVSGHRLGDFQTLWEGWGESHSLYVDLSSHLALHWPSNLLHSIL